MHRIKYVHVILPEQVKAIATSKQRVEVQEHRSVSRIGFSVVSSMHGIKDRFQLAIDKLKNVALKITRDSNSHSKFIRTILGAVNFISLAV